MAERKGMKSLPYPMTRPSPRRACAEETKLIGNLRLYTMRFSERCPRGNRRISLLSRLDGPRGVAGKLGTMAATGEKQGNTTKKKQKPTGKKQRPADKNGSRRARKRNRQGGRTPTRAANQAAQTSREKNAPAVMGAARLRSSINSLVEKESKGSAMALVDHAKAGNVSSAKLLVSSRGPMTRPRAEKKQRS